MAQRGAGHGHRQRKGLRIAADALQLAQQQVGHAGFVHALHHHVNGRSGEDAVILGFQAGGGDVYQLAGITAQLDARRGITEEFAAGLAHAVEALGVELCFQAAGLGLGLNAHGLGVEDAVYEVGVKDGAEHNVGVGVGKVLARQCVGVLDAADVGGQHAVRPGTGKIHAQVSAVQFGQAAGQGGHIGAGRIAALQHQGQHSGIGGGLTLRREAQMDRDAAAIEFSGAHRSDEHAGSKLFTFQVLIPFKQQIDICIIPLQWVKVNKKLAVGYAERL